MPGEEILDNYGYHYAVMSKEERQRKLQSQYYFGCECGACKECWPIYTGLATAAVPLPGTAPDQVRDKVLRENSIDILRSKQDGLNKFDTEEETSNGHENTS